MMRPVIKEVSTIGKYKINVLFQDGIEGIYDLEGLAGRGIFRNWDEKDNFEKVFVDPLSGAIAWPGEIDIDTITVYCALRGIGVDEYCKPSFHHAQDQ